MSCKKEIRREMIARRKAEGVGKDSDKIVKAIKKLPEYQKANSVMLYMPILGEVDVTELLKDDKMFLTPVTEGEDIYPCPVTGDFVKGAFGVPEPDVKAVLDKAEIDIVIVPGVAFDKAFNRMGYGKGYYDRFLRDMNALKVGVCHAFQMVDELPCEEHDIRMDIIITEEDIWIRESI